LVQLVDGLCRRKSLAELFGRCADYVCYL
jgi:hypothetical protein